MSVVLSLDAMGGDRAPDVVVEGAALAAEKYRDLTFLIYGPSHQIGPLLHQYPQLKDRCTLYHTDEVITNDVKPAQALRGFKKSSMRLAIEAVAQGHAQAVVSAGNTGAYMALSKIFLKSIPGISRPAIATAILSQNGRTVVLDLGATVAATPENLYQFALMGHAFASRYLHKKHPTIGLLNVGSEEQKGHSTVQDAAILIREDKNLTFYGFVEGDDIMAGTTDVVVTDGFTGNVALKSMEGTARLVKDLLKESLSSSWRGKLGYLIASPVFKKMQQKIDPRYYNGAAFLGVQGVAIKSHGGTDGFGFSVAIGVAVEMASGATQGTVAQDIQSLIE